ncbi:hypothetical protein ACBJ59_10575 [Nonomuraea sp. MTCD27]|uniref:hypothetical protein n=1 Tax=Nonomuraea sp. MTCD27 TaxID=1676747 RepID=UPI0035C1352B
MSAGERGDDPPPLLRVLLWRRRRRGPRRSAVQVVEGGVGVRLDLFQLPGQHEQRGRLDGLLPPVDPACVDDVEQVSQRQVGQP